MTSLKANNRQELEAKIINKARNDDAFRQKLLEFPTETILKELGLEYEPNGFKFEVLEETSERLYLVLPLSHDQTTTLANDGKEISDPELEKQLVRSQSRVIQKCSEHSVETGNDGVDKSKSSPKNPDNQPIPNPQTDRAK